MYKRKQKTKRTNFGGHAFTTFFVNTKQKFSYTVVSKMKCTEKEMQLCHFGAFLLKQSKWKRNVVGFAEGENFDNFCHFWIFSVDLYKNIQ